MATGGDVVDDRRAGLERRGGDGAPCVVSMLTGTPAVGRERARRPGSTRRSSSSAATGVGARAGRLAADVEHVGARGDQREAVRDGGVGVEEAAAVGERVGGDVDDAHHRAPGDRHARPVEHRRAAYRRSGREARGPRRHGSEAVPGVGDEAHRLGPGGRIVLEETRAPLT